MSQTHLDFDFLVAEERNQVRDNSRVYHHLDLLIASIREIGESPDCIYQNLPGEKNSSETAPEEWALLDQLTINCNQCLCALTGRKGTLNSRKCQQFN